MAQKFSKLRITSIAVSLLASLTFFWIAWSVYEEHNRIQGFEFKAVGYITKKHYSRASDGNALYFIDYEFSIEGRQKINSTNSVLKQHWDVFKVGDSLEIRYDKSNPKRNLPLYGGSGSLMYAFFVFALGLVFLIFGLMRLLHARR